MDRKEVLSTLTLIGTIIGVGIFALPYLLQQVGLERGILYFIFVGIVVLLFHLMFGEVIQRTKGNMRLPGYAERYLGRFGKESLFISTVLGYFLSLIIYVIIGGQFINTLFPQISNINLGISAQFTGALIFFIIIVVLFVAGLKDFGRVGMPLFIGLVLVLLMVIGFCIPKISLANISLLPSPADSFDYFKPIGVLLFAFIGVSAIPSMNNILKPAPQKLKRSIIIGTVIPVVLFFVFAFAVVGVSGSATTQNAIDALKPFLGQPVIIMGAILGLLAIVTSFLPMAFYLRDSMVMDYRIKPFFATILIILGCSCAFLFVKEDNAFNLMSLAGLIFGGVEGVVLMAVFRKAKKEGDHVPSYSLSVSSLVIYLISAVFVISLVYETYQFFTG